MIEPAALALTIAMLMGGVLCLRLGASRAGPRPSVRAGDALFEANILVAYGATARARALLEAACRAEPDRLALSRRLAEIVAMEQGAFERRSARGAS